MGFLYILCIRFVVVMHNSTLEVLVKIDSVNG